MSCNCGGSVCSSNCDGKAPLDSNSSVMAWKSEAITAAQKWGINPILLLAITEMESNGNADALCLMSPYCTSCGQTQSATCCCGNCSYGIVQIGENNGGNYSCDCNGSAFSASNGGMLSSYNVGTGNSLTPCDLTGSSGAVTSFDIIARYISSGLKAAKNDGLSDVCAFAGVATSWNGNCSASCGGSCFAFTPWSGGTYYGPKTADGVSNYGASAAYIASNSQYWGTGVFDTTSMGGSTTSGSGVSKSSIYYYAATPVDMDIAVTVADSLGVPGANVTGYFNQAWTWASSKSNLVIAVGADATDALYKNPCGWNNQTAGSTPFVIVGPGPDSANSGVWVNQLPPNSYSGSSPWFMNAGGGGYLWETYILSYLLGYYAINGAFPSWYNSSVSIAQHTPSTTCPSGLTTPVSCTNNNATN